MPARMLAPVQAFHDYRMFGVLPRAGGSFDQDALLMEEMRIVAGVVNEDEHAKAEKEARKK
jgi:hypothetical protein